MRAVLVASVTICDCYRYANCTREFNIIERKRGKRQQSMKESESERSSVHKKDIKKLGAKEQICFALDAIASVIMR